MNLLTMRLALRNLLRQRFFTLINLAGLALGLATVLLLTGSIYDELHWDTWHTNGDRIQRLYMAAKNQEDTRLVAYTMPGIAPELEQSLPQVEYAVRVFGGTRQRIRHGDKPFEYAESVYLTDPNFFEIFTFPLKYGDPATALDSPGKMVLSAKKAEQMFGDVNPLGELVYLGGDDPFTVTGVAEEPPGNTHIPFAMLLPVVEIGEEYLSSWSWMNFGTYLLLSEGTDPVQLVDSEEWNGFFYPRVDIDEREFFLQPLSEIHFGGETILAPQVGVTTRTTLLVLVGIGLLVLTISTINFMNLSTALASRRMRESAVLKVVGAGRGGIVVQQLMESLLCSIAAGLIAIAIAQILHPYFSSMIAKPDLTIPTERPVLMVIYAGVLLLVGIAAGLYPGWFLARSEAVNALKGTATRGAKGSRARQGLVMVQYVISIVFIISTIIIHNQLAFVNRVDLGFDRERVITFSGVGGEMQRMEDLLARFRRLPGVVAATYASGIPGRSMGVLSVIPEGKQDRQLLRFLTVEEDALNTFRLEMVTGRFISRDHPFDIMTDSTGSVVLNEAAVRYLGWEDDPLSHTLKLGSNEHDASVVGVVKDFHQNSLREKIEPMMLLKLEGFRYANTVAVRYDRDDVRPLMDDIRTTWMEVFPGYPIRFSFMDQKIDELYQRDRQQALILQISSILAILIASLGLIALTTFAAQRRTKEIGIRKVLGAETSQLVALMLREFVLLVALANIVAWPVAYYAMSRWLDGFVFSIPFTWWTLPVAGIAALLFAVLSTSFIALRTAARNPVDTLRYE